MEFYKTKLKDCYSIKPIRHKDIRGYFQETFHKEKYSKFLPVSTNFVQDNLSKSKKGVVRGIHFQLKKFQGKLVRVIAGEIYDVAVDLRLNSPTFGKYHAEILSEKNFKQLWIPEGFGHGFMTLSEEAILEYKCTNFYSPENEQTLIWNDKSLSINWPQIDKITVSEKDESGLEFNKILELLRS